MRLVLAVALGAAALAGCSREPRSVAYFEAHPEEAVRVAAGCVDGAHRGSECDQAQAAAADTARKARMSRYQQNF